MKRLIIIGFLFLTAACSNPFGDEKTTIDDGYGPNAKLPAPTSFGTVSGSNLGGTTANGKTVEIAVGVPTSKIKVTTSRNRTVFVSVQGQIISN